MIKLGDSNDKYNNWEYNCTYCFNINGILWYAKTKEKKLMYNQIIPLSLVKINIEEVNLVDEINTIEEATNKAIILARRRIEEDLTDKEYVISSKLLKREIKDSKIECVVFFTVYEDITEYKIVEELE